MAVKKSELYRSLWAQCDALRGGMDASQYKDYVLVLLFMKYVSDKYAGRKDGLIEIPKGCSYADIVALAGKSNIGEEIDKKIAEVAKANELEGVINLASFNDDEKLGKGKELVDRVSDLVKEFDKAELNFKHNRAEDDDLLGDAYEYLMRHFATESGKSKGQFYTPAEVSRIMAQIIGLENVKKSTQSVYDLACGSGSLLMKAYDYAKQHTGVEMSVYGQEMDNATYGLARMNCVLHDNPTAEIAKGNTLADPQFKDKPDQVKRFDFAVANPPFSWKKWTQGLTGDDGKGVVDEFKRFDGYAVPPPKNGDYAFLLHMLASLKSTGTGCIVMPHGVLFRGNKEETIRTELIRKGYIKGIIGLPANLFYGTGIPACLIVIDKKDADSRKAIFMIDASRGFRKDGPKNRLREQDLHRIVDVFNSQDESDPKFARLVPLKEIKENGYNLNIPRYIDSSEPEDLQDIEAHLLGGIPNRDIDALQEYWDVFPSLRKTLFKKGDRKGYSELKIEPEAIRETIFSHDEFRTYAEQMDAVFDKWSTSVRPTLEAIDKNTSPRKLITELGESILEAYEGQPLINAYRVYQHLMDYWTETMKDDVYMVIENGWEASPRELVKEKGKGWPEGAILIKDGKKQRAYLSELLPKPVIVERYLKEEQLAITNLGAERDLATAEREALLEENSGEDGLLSEVINDKGNVTKGELTRRIKELSELNDEEEQEELSVLRTYLNSVESESRLNSLITQREYELDVKALECLNATTNADTQAIVIDLKWLSQISGRLSGDRQQSVEDLYLRIIQLAERYRFTLSQLEARFEKFREKNAKHLDRLAGEGHLVKPGSDRAQWEERRLDELGENFAGLTYSPSQVQASGTLVLRASNIQDGQLCLKDSVFVEADIPEKIRTQKGDLLVCVRNGSRSLIGKSLLLDERTEGETFGAFMSVFRGECSKYLSFLFDHPIIKKQIDANLGATINQITGKMFDEFTVPMPPTEERDAIIEILSDMKAESDALVALRNKTDLLRTGVAQELLSGRRRLV